MTNYKIKIRGSQGWKRHKNSKLNVSVSQPALNGEKLESIIEWINNNFDYCIVSIGDTLNRHNLLADGTLSPAKAHEVSSQMGTDWLKRNEKALNRFIIPHQILRWDDSLTEATLKLITEYQLLYTKDKGFQQAVNTDVSRYSKRKSIEAVDYILEEIAVDTSIARTHPNATLYTGNALTSYDYIRENGNKICAPHGLENEHHVYIDPRRRKSISTISQQNRKLMP